MIVSRQNAFIKEIRSLADKKFRDRLNLYVAEGVKTVNEAIDCNQDIFAIVCTEGAREFIHKNDFRLELVSQDVFKSISGEVSPQGALAVIRKPVEQTAKLTDSVILLDGVADPANVGAVIRTAVAAGYNEVFLTSDCADAFNPKAVRASMSGIFRVSLHVIEREQIDALIKLPLIIADMNGENVFAYKPSGEFCLVIGNEGKGVSQQVKRLATKTVSIPMQNQMESLNAAVSAGILMYLLKNNTL